MQVKHGCVHKIILFGLVYFEWRDRSDVLMFHKKKDVSKQCK